MARSCSPELLRANIKVFVVSQKRTSDKSGNNFKTILPFSTRTREKEKRISEQKHRNSKQFLKSEVPLKKLRFLLFLLRLRNVETAQPSYLVCLPPTVFAWNKFFQFSHFSPNFFRIRIGIQKLPREENSQIFSLQIQKFEKPNENFAHEIAFLIIID